VRPQRGVEDLQPVLIWSLPGCPDAIPEVVDCADDCAAAEQVLKHSVIRWSRHRCGATALWR
jgi:hypothetical protein